MNENIQNKLHKFEAEPPREAWDRIEALLDANRDRTIAGKMLAFETNPPAGSWEKIAQHLESKQAPVIPFSVRYRKLLRTGTAAAVLVAAFFTTYLLMNRQPAPDPASPAVVNSSVPVVPGLPSESPGEQPTVPRLVAAEPRTAGKPQQRQKENRSAESIRLAIQASAPLALLDGFIPKTAERSSPISFSATDGKYMVYSSDDGYAVRLPKKLYDAIACPPQDMLCKQRIKTLQEKAASAAITSDFAGVLEILNTISENQ
ncbi:MAG TPA: hypothetical protein VFR58_16180 [Flavisolibacter sp.]|nr:hypothetical protein [Flavisolibacter sp.]